MNRIWKEEAITTGNSYGAHPELREKSSVTRIAVHPVVWGVGYKIGKDTLRFC
ncbi:hypothetical protein [Faecalibaculum rodentium]|uniref:hypothetical protein n=1 Tax=Faecalibaculum rodentium TaxID=1702221 RepID=UPI003F6706AA